MKTTMLKWLSFSSVALLSIAYGEPKFNSDKLGDTDSRRPLLSPSAKKGKRPVFRLGRAANIRIRRGTNTNRTDNDYRLDVQIYYMQDFGRSRHSSLAGSSAGFIGLGEVQRRKGFPIGGPRLKYWNEKMSIPPQVYTLVKEPRRVVEASGANDAVFFVFDFQDLVDQGVDEDISWRLHRYEGTKQDPVRSSRTYKFNAHQKQVFDYNTAWALRRRADARWLLEVKTPQEELDWEFQFTRDG